jgi:hypothetical protein
LIAPISRHKLALGASLALVLMLLQFAVVRLSPGALPVRIVLPLTIALAPLALWPLRRSFGVWIIYVGLAANLAAILANGGLMPIERSTVVEAVGQRRAAQYATNRWVEGSKDVLVDDGGGRFTVLGDGIIVRIGSGGFAASPGDFVIWAGLLVLMSEGAVAWQRGGRRGEASVGRVPRRAEGSASTPP